MYCSNCGKLLDDDAKFCKYCGHDCSKDIEESISHVEETEDTLSKAVDSKMQVAPALEDTKVSDTNDSAKEEVSDTAKVVTKPKKKRHRKQREIEDEMSINAYTIKDDMVEKADILPKERIKLRSKGALTKLKTKEIVLIVISVLLMVAAAVTIYFTRATGDIEENAMNGLVIVSYLMFFVVFFALCLGIDRIYNLLTLNELSIRRITVKKYGWRLCPLALIHDEVFEIEVEGECDMCNTENKGTYHIEWQNDSLIAVCNYDRHHLYKVKVEDILGQDYDTPSDDIVKDVDAIEDSTTNSKIDIDIDNTIDKVDDEL